MRAAAAVILLAIVGAPRAALAGPSDDARARAAESFRQAQGAFERRDFAAAAAAFEAAAGFVPHPAAWLSAADAWQRAGDPARAAEDCDNARGVPGLDEAAASDHVDYARDAARCLERVRGRVALLEIAGGGATAVRVDGGSEQVLPTRRWMQPGHHVLMLVNLQSARTQRVEIDLMAGEDRKVDAPPPESVPNAVSESAPAAATAPAPASGAASHPLPTASWVAFGLAVPAAVAYAVTGVLTIQAQHDFDASPSASARDAFHRDRTMADVSFTVAATAAVAGVLLWLLAPSDAPPRVGAIRF